MIGSVRLAAATLALLALGAAPASAGQLLSTTVQAEGASARNCIGGVLGGSSVAKRSVTAPSAGWVTARLKGARGDWDLAVFDAASGRRVTGSAYFGADEVAKGLVATGQELTVQACRRSNSSERAALEVESDAIDPDAATGKASLVRVSTPNAARKRELTNLGVDLTEHGGKGFVEVVLHGAADARRLRGAKFVYTTEVRNLSDQTRSNLAADRRYSAAVSKSALPSGRDTYRMLEDYSNEMKQLVAQNPNLVKPITLPLETGEGRKVEGIEITENVKARDGKPVFAQMGLHHAREWPSGEHAMEFAYELVNGYKSNNARIRPLVARTRTIVIPVVNPDGFNFSRLAGEAQGATVGGGRGAPDPGEDDETVNIVSHPGEYRRKNCRLSDSSTDANCAAAPSAGVASVGVDPNRNYGGLWGGPGNSSDPTNETYRGPAPFSEPETRNIKQLVSSRQVTTLITNHTFSDLVLRPPGVAILGPPPDETKGYKALGDAMAAQNGYTSQKGFELYDTTGTTEDWSYGATGGFGFTFEIGCVTELPNGSCDVGHFHPPYSEVVKEYEGTSTRADEGGRDGKGNREAYLIALESTGNENRHVVIDGKATPGAVLRLKKSFLTKTSPVLDASGQEGPVQTFPDVLDTTMQVGSSGFYRYHANPSTRPDVAIQRGRAPTGPASPPQSFTGGIAGPPADGAVPGGDAESANPLTFNEHVITVPSGGFDNAKMTIRIEWAAVTDDWDTKLFRDTNGNSAVDPGEPVVGTSQQGTTDFEQVSIPNPAPGAKYIYRVTNFAAGPQGAYDGKVTFSQPFFQAAQRESWTMTCESAETGKVGERVSVLIDRGQRKTVSFGAPCRRVVEAGRCVGTRGGVKSTRVGGAKLARSRKSQRRRLRVARLARGRRAGLDRYCVQGGGTTRVGYPTKRFNSKISRKTRKRYASKAIFIVSNSKRFRLKKLRPGSRVRTLRRRLKGERSFKVGKIRWYTVAGKRSRLLFSTRRGKVREVGLASKRLTSTRRGTVRLLRAWDKRG